MLNNDLLFLRLLGVGWAGVGVRIERATAEQARARWQHLDSHLIYFKNQVGHSDAMGQLNKNWAQRPTSINEQQSTTMASSQQQLHDTLSSAVATVQAKRVQFEDSVVRPGLDRTKQLGSDYPVGAVRSLPPPFALDQILVLTRDVLVALSRQTFLTVFTVLSLVPILSFL